MGCFQCKTDCKTACKTIYLKMVNYINKSSKKLDVKKTDEPIVDVEKINDLFEPRLKDSPVPVPPAIPVPDNEFDYEMVN
jgi:hypothetical protein